jgi:hypothetical protein
MAAELQPLRPLRTPAVASATIVVAGCVAPALGSPWCGVPDRSGDPAIAVAPSVAPPRLAPLKEELLRLVEVASAESADLGWSVDLSDRAAVPHSMPREATVTFESARRDWRLRVEARTELTEHGDQAGSLTGRLQVVRAGTDGVRSHRDRANEVVLSWPALGLDECLQRLDLLDQTLRFVDWRAAASLWERIDDFELSKRVEEDSRVRWSLAPRDRPRQVFDVVVDTAGSPRIVEFTHWINVDPKATLRHSARTTAVVHLDGLRRPQQVVRTTHDETGAILRTITLTVTRCEPAPDVAALVRAELVPSDGTIVFDPDRRVMFVAGTPEIHIGQQVYRLKEPLRVYRPDLLESILAGDPPPDAESKTDAPARAE